MIVVLGNLATTNDGTEKTVEVFAMEDSAGGNEVILFTVLDQHVKAQAAFAPNESKVVSAKHTASGKGLVVAAAAGSKEMASAILDVDRKPGDNGM